MPFHQPEIPGLPQSALFLGKSSLLKLSRALKDLSSNPARRYPRRDALRGEQVLSESTSKLWSGDTASESRLQGGKVHNLRIALRSLNKVEVPGGAIFSFWAQVGRASRWKGYVEGRELREGCLIPAVGGGLCQLSNALYDAALKAGFEIVERHAHSRVIPGSLAESGRDATIFWNYVDLRFKSAKPFRIEASMTADCLTVRLKGQRIAPSAAAGVPVRLHPTPESCAGCGVAECFRSNELRLSPVMFGRAAWLVDEFWPEYDRYIQENRSEEDVLALPLDGKQLRKPSYAWKTEGFHRVKESRWTTFLRSLAVRRVSSKGAERQRALLSHDDRLAQSYSSLLTSDVLHVTVMQNLLPSLWHSGHLGGRTFDVLMTRLPLAHLHARLDEASHRLSESRTLADFRAGSLWVESEAQALQHARRIITPHRKIAALFGRKAVLLDWEMPSCDQPVRRGPLVVFPFSTLGACRGI